jgi:hypothetical protein
VNRGLIVSALGDYLEGIPCNGGGAGRRVKGRNHPVLTWLKAQRAG